MRENFRTSLKRFSFLGSICIYCSVNFCLTQYLKVCDILLVLCQKRDMVVYSIRSCRGVSHTLHAGSGALFCGIYQFMFYIVGLGNPGEEYENSRHNTGALSVQSFAKKNDFSPWDTDKKLKALVSVDKIGKEKAELILPQTFMNKSGDSLKSLIISKKKAESLVVIYDDLDMPLGKFKISFGRGSGGHKGIESIARAIKTKDFIRIRIGISSSTPKGKIKKPKGEKKIIDFILGSFSKKETETLKKVFKKINEAISTIILEGRAKAMNKFN